MLELPSDLDGVEDCLSAALHMLQEMIQDTREDNDFNLFMENKYFLRRGRKEKGILIFASEFWIGIIVMNAEMQNTQRVGPYSTKTKKLYRNLYLSLPEC